MKYKFGLIAKDIKNSVTPSVYRHYGKDLGDEIEFEIKNVPEDQLEATLAYGRENWDGFNVTMPYKQAALKYMDEVDESAVKCGSTNTVMVKGGKLVAYNTDGWGMVHLLGLKGVPVAGKKIVMLGAGGVAYSIAYHMSVQNVAQADVVNIFPEQAEALCEKFGSKFRPYPFTYEILEQCCAGADLFVNASVMGQLGYDEFENFNFLDKLAPGAAAFDVNYSNPDSKLVPAAIAKGLPAWRGKGMTACQGIRAFEIWTGKRPSEASALALIKEFEEA